MKPTQNLSFQELKASIPKETRLFSLAGIASFVVFGLGGGIWAVTAPLESAVIASGNFIATGANKTIQHLEGGIVQKILVKEGDSIEKGQILVRLDKTKSDAEYARLYKRKTELLVYQARLKWELDNHKTAFDPAKQPGALAVFQEKETQKLIAEQQAEFQAGLENRHNQIARLQNQLGAEHKKKAGLLNVRQALQKRMSEIDRQMEKKRNLLKRGLTTRSSLDVLSLTRTQDQATFNGNLSQIEQSRERILELEQTMHSVDLANREAKSKELRTVNSELSDIGQRLVQAKDITKRIFVRAPVKGVVVQLSLNTEGGVIAPGQKIMEILPTQNTLQIQALVTPTDIDDIAKGQRAMIQLSALNQRTTPMVEGEVTYVSADLIQPAPDQVGSYIVRINLLEEDMKRAKSLKAVPGMPVAVFIKTGSQTFWQYLTRPIVDSFQKAGREK